MSGLDIFTWIVVLILVATPAEWSAEVEDSGEVDDGWLAGFDDPQLDALAAEAAGLARAAGAALKPAVGFAGDVAETGGDALASGTSYGASLAVSWEVDVWGRVRAGARAGEAALQATVADYEYARPSLVASVAKTWFLATEAKLQRALIEEAVETLPPPVPVGLPSAIIARRPDLAAVGRREIRIRGGVSARCKQELAASGWNIHDQVAFSFDAEGD